MTAQKQSPLEPKLRFPEFRDGPGWAPKQLSEILDYEQPGAYIVEDTSYQDTGTPVLTANKSFVLGYTAETDGIYNNVPAIIFDDFTTAAKYVDFAFKVKSSAIKILTSRRDYELKLVFELMSRIRFDPTQHKRYYISQYQHLEIALPERPEQQKVAACLGSLDDLIEAEGRKLEALRQHKQGLMQQLFPEEAETQPRLRFPEFRHAGEWEETRISDLEPFVTSGSRGWAAFYAPQGSLFVRITNLSRESISLDLADPKYVKLPADTNESSRTALKDDDVLVSITADIGIIGYVDTDTPSPAYINQHIALVRFKSPNVRGKFVAYFLASEWAQRQFRSATDNGAKAGMNLMGVQAINLLLPPPPEQQCIADCLTSLDVCIAKQTQKLDVLKRHKQGLLQQLFPGLEEESR